VSTTVESGPTRPRFAATSFAPGHVVVLAAAGVLAGLVAFALVAGSARYEEPIAAAAVGLVTAWSFIGTGLLARSRGAPDRVFALMIALGFAWAVAPALGEIEGRWSHALGALVGNAACALFVHVLLAFPAGRLTTRAERSVVAVSYLNLVGVEAARLLADGPPAGDRARGTLPVVGEGVFPAPVSALQGAVAGAVAVAALAILARRWYWATRPVRRSLAPVLVAGGAVLALLLVRLLAEAAAPSLQTSLGWLGALTLAAVPLAVLGSLVQAQLARAGLGPLVLELGRAGSPGALRDALARALGDPSLRIGYWLPDAGSYVDLAGRPFELPWEGSRQATTRVERDGRHIAALVHDASLLDDPALVDAVTAAAGLALDNERLHAELRANLDDLRASRARLVEAGDAERRRLERNLHDGAQQRLVALSLSLRLAEARIPADPDAAVGLLVAAREELARALEELRELARGIHPAVLSDHGLRRALESVALRQPVPVALAVPEERLPPAVEVAAYYLISEALANIAKYAEATEASVRVTRTGAQVLIEVADDGVGGADPAAGSGLRGLGDRVAALGGTLEVDSPRGRGTRIVAEIPCE
jgi:signal transduction histidine kinase